jgi:hypothetical protein
MRMWGGVTVCCGGRRQQPQISLNRSGCKMCMLYETARAVLLSHACWCLRSAGNGSGKVVMQMNRWGRDSTRADTDVRAAVALRLCLEISSMVGPQRTACECGVQCFGK